MTLRSRRERDRMLTEREASGESLWTEAFDSRAVTRLNEIWRLMDEVHYERTGNYRRSSEVAAMLRIQGGWTVPAALSAGALQPSNKQNLEFTLDILEAFIKTFASDFVDIDDEVNTVLREHRIGYRVVEHEVLSRGSDELHVSVVEPALRLLIDSRFAKAHDAYMDALKEITAGKPGDAITDVGTALQETLTALGCSGNALGPLITDAAKRGILAPHDRKIADWVSADRSATGDAHHHSVASEADAWLAVHVAGALIVRLADPNQKRGA